MLFQHSMIITHQLMPFYFITVHENLLNIAFEVAETVGDIIRHQHATRVVVQIVYFSIKERNMCRPISNA